MKCKNCKQKNAVKYSKYTTGDFCSRECARAYSTKTKRIEINEKVSRKLKGKSPNIQYLKEKNNGIYKSGSNVLKISICDSCEKEFYSKNKIKHCKECNKLFRRTLMFKKLKVFEKNLINSKNKAIILLKNEYFEKKMSIPEICKKHKICLRTVWKFLNDNGINFRSFSDAVCLTYKNGRLASSGNKGFQSGYHITWYGKKIFYRSSYEKRVIDVLDKNKIEYLYESKRINYMYKNEEHTYISDFYFPKEKTIIETKNRHLQKRDRLKIAAEKEYVEKSGILFFLAGENEIKKIEKNESKYLKGIFSNKEKGADINF